MRLKLSFPPPALSPGVVIVDGGGDGGMHGSHNTILKSSTVTYAVKFYVTWEGGTRDSAKIAPQGFVKDQLIIGDIFHLSKT